MEHPMFFLSLFWSGFATPGDWGLALNKQKKGFSPLAHRAFFEDSDITVHTCSNQKTKNSQTKQLKQTQYQKETTSIDKNETNKKSNRQNLKTIKSKGENKNDNK